MDKNEVATNDVVTEQNTGQTPAPTSSKSNGKGLLIALLLILALGGIGFGIYGMFFANRSTTENGGTENGDTTAAQITEAYEVRDIREKVFRLLGKRNGFGSESQYYNPENKTFSVSKLFMPTQQLFNNELTDAEKVYITLETTNLDKDKQCSKWEDDVVADLKSLLGDNAIRDEIIDSYYRYGECIDYDDANSDYYDLFGSIMPKIVDGLDLGYGANSNNYFYHIIGGRGSAGYSNIVGKIANVETGGDIATIDINMGILSAFAEDGVKLSSDILQPELVHDYGNIMIKDVVITDEQYEALSQYRFVFKKNGDNIYSFDKVEKL